MLVERYDDALRAPEPGKQGNYVSLVGRVAGAPAMSQRAGSSRPAAARLLGAASLGALVACGGGSGGGGASATAERPPGERRADRRRADLRPAPCCTRRGSTSTPRPGRRCATTTSRTSTTPRTSTSTAPPSRRSAIRSRGEGSRNEEKPGLKLDFNKYVPWPGVLRLQEPGARQPGDRRQHDSRAARVPGLRGDGHPRAAQRLREAHRQRPVLGPLLAWSSRSASRS